MVQIRHVKQLDLSLTPTPWAFAEEHRAEIEAHFATVREAKPAVWNGRVLLCRNPRVEDDVYRADYFETDFASFLAWRDWGFPDKSVFNSFGAGALRSADGTFVLGRMNGHTANAGRIYFPAGTPDPNDVADGRVDLAASVMREVEEEIGLTHADYHASDHWTIVETGQVAACFRLLASPLATPELRERIETFLRSETTPELSGVKLVRSAADFDTAMPAFVTAFLKGALSPVR
jgi:8-oxo-dGTP pyrophosphatase MutT (NUDIX family)